MASPAETSSGRVVSRAFANFTPFSNDGFLSDRSMPAKVRSEQSACSLNRSLEGIEPTGIVPCGTFSEWPAYGNDRKHRESCAVPGRERRTAVAQRAGAPVQQVSESPPANL